MNPYELLEIEKDKWVVKNTATEEFFDFESKGISYWWSITDGEWQANGISYYDEGYCFTDYKTAKAKYKELINGETTVKNTEEFVNANIKSKRELARRLLDGEVFYSQSSENKVYFDPAHETPFRFSEDKLERYWDSYDQLLVKKAWHDCLIVGGEPVLCFVSNTSETDLENMNDIKWIYEYMSHRNYPFIVAGVVASEDWKYARPVTKEDIL